MSNEQPPRGAGTSPATVNVLVWLMSLGLVAVSVGALDQYDRRLAWGLVFLIVLSALVLDHQSALAGLTDALDAAKG